MGIRFFAHASALAAVVCIASALYYKDVTAKDFDKLIDTSNSAALLEFYAPWCGHCKQLAPEYEKLGETFSKSSDVIIAQIDADKHKKLAKRFSIEGYPTLKWVPKGTTPDKAEEVDADRTAEALVEFVNKKAGLSKKLQTPESHVVELTAENFEETVLAPNVIALVGFFAPWCGHCKAMKPTWEKLAALYADEEGVVIGAVNCDDEKDLASEYKIEGFPTIKYFSNDGEPVSDYAGGRDLKEFTTFVNEKAGLDIAPDGGVTPSGGIVEEIGEHIKTYLAADTEEERTNIVTTCNEAVSKLGEQAQGNYKYYAKVFAKIAQNGKEYVAKEKERLSKMLESSDSLRTTQKRSFMRRINVLTAFDEL